tara:strand:+ start:680 stop:898 length:219 start_codon:yes stop_codon:yes gene_type:complete
MWNKLKAFLKWAVANDLKQPEEKAVEPEPVTERVRTRTVKGRFIADDKSTPNIDEAWTKRKVNIKRIKKRKK